MSGGDGEEAGAQQRPVKAVTWHEIRLCTSFLNLKCDFLRFSASTYQVIVRDSSPRERKRAPCRLHACPHARHPCGVTVQL
jgi:hypothetical protein